MQTDRRSPIDEPTWKVVIVAAACALAWPAVVAVPLWRARRFQKLARRGSGTRFRVTEDGLEVARGTEAPRLLAWSGVGEARWLVHVTRTMASGDEQTYLVHHPGQQVTLVGDGKAMLPLRDALVARGASPRMEDGGGSIGAAGWIATMAWFAVVLTGCCVWMW